VGSKGWDGFDMKVYDRITVLLSTLALIVSVIVLCISEDARSIYKGPELSLSKDYVDLKKVGGGSGYVGFAKIENKGGASSEKLKLIISFDGAIPKYDVQSDEDVGGVVVKDKDVRVSLDRLSSNASVNISMYSGSPFLYSVKFVDDSGGGEVGGFGGVKSINLINVFFIFLMIVSLLFLLRVFKRVSEADLKLLLENHHASICKDLRDVRNEIGDIEVFVNAAGTSQSTEPALRSKGVAQRLSEFMGKIS
jgi:hypothetical protein